MVNVCEMYTLLGDRHINLMMIENGERRHFCLIKSMSRLLAGLTKHGHTAYYCDFCLHRFARKETLDAHLVDCEQHGAQKIKMPTDQWLRFDKHHFQLAVPYVIYADFESILVKRSTCQPDPSDSSTTAVANHLPCGYAYFVIGKNIYLITMNFIPPLIVTLNRYFF